MTAEATRALILYAYTLGGNTREMARLTGISHDDVADMLALAAHEDAMAGLPDEPEVQDTADEHDYDHELSANIEREAWQRAEDW